MIPKPAASPGNYRNANSWASPQPKRRSNWNGGGGQPVFSGALKVILVLATQLREAQLPPLL